MNIEQVLTLIQEEIEQINPVPAEYLKSKGNDNGFEELFPIIAEKVATRLQPDDILQVIPQLGHHFPDVDLILNDSKYGVELKSRNNGTWSTNGNSVLESITDEGYEEIYLFFGSKIPNEQRLLVRFAPYWQTTKAIKVTHSPRFFIDITDTHTSVFKSKQEYDSLRNLDERGKVNFLQEYLKNNTEGTKWYVAPEEPNIPLNFSELGRNKKNELRAEIFLLYPSDLLGRSKGDYSRATLYLIKNHYVYSNALRDKFSASGKYENNGFYFPRMYHTLKELSGTIEHILAEASNDFIELLYTAWRQDGLLLTRSENIFTDYKIVINTVMEQSTNTELIEDLKAANMYPLTTYLF